eukprot:758449-Hanusia_phi.AAC.6
MESSDCSRCDFSCQGLSANSARAQLACLRQNLHVGPLLAQELPDESVSALQVGRATCLQTLSSARAPSPRVHAASRQNHPSASPPDLNVAAQNSSR